MDRAVPMTRPTPTVNDLDPAERGQRVAHIQDEKVLLLTVYLLDDADPGYVTHPAERHGAFALQLVDDRLNGLQPGRGTYVGYLPSKRFLRMHQHLEVLGSQPL